MIEASGGDGRATKTSGRRSSARLRHRLPLCTNASAVPVRYTLPKQICCKIIEENLVLAVEGVAVGAYDRRHETGPSNELHQCQFVRSAQPAFRTPKGFPIVLA